MLIDNTEEIQYDSLDQAVLLLEPDPNNPGSTLGQTSTTHDSLGQVTQVIDPRNLVTIYQKDNLGNLLSLTSPDTGATQNTYDDAGDLLTRTDALGNSVTYSYDSQNRITQIVYQDQIFVYGWDTCTNGIDRLCSLTNAGISLNLNYNLNGRVTSKSQTVGTVTLSTGYTYNNVGQLIQTITPSGQTIGYVWLNDHIKSITLNGQPLITQVAYEPDGQIAGWIWSNGTTSERQYDLAGHPIAVSLGPDVQSLLPTLHNYSYDAAGKVISIVDSSNPALDQTYIYDGLNRLITGQQGTFTLTDTNYTYDLNGNRTAKILNNTTSEIDGIDPGSNKLLQKNGAQTVNYSYDVAGHITSNGTISYIYNGQGRRSGATSANLNASYGYNALGQRVNKTVNGITTLFFYDQRGQLAGEYDATGQLIQETVWLGDLPIAVLKPNTAQSSLVDIFYIHSDHLATPRKIARPSDNKVLWTWESEAFGNSLPNTNPSNLGNFTFNLRFPGQYFDQETGLHYNYYRDYDPSTGRYIESDPIGLAGGINTYTYVNNNPLRYIDPYGLWAWGDPLNQSLVNAAAGFGDGISSIATLGMYSTADVRNGFGINGGVNQCSESYAGGKYAGYSWGAGTLWAAGLNGGANSIFWSGYNQGARGIAESLGGTTLESTPIGRALNFASNTLNIPGLGPVWNTASATFAANVSGTAIAVVLSESATSVWATIELPILTARSIPIIFH